MSQGPPHNKSVSLGLSAVLEDIGVNERIVMKRRTVQMLMETMINVMNSSCGVNVTEYFLGSRSEGTTTEGLHSDFDILKCCNGYNVMQGWSEWKQNKVNLLMIQDQNVTPGYCCLQLLRSDEPLPEINILNTDTSFTTERNGKILIKNTFANKKYQRPDSVRSGPSQALSGTCCKCAVDNVPAFPCKSWPKAASQFLERQGVGRWRSPEMIRYAASNGCFVVPTSSKISIYPELEWRISTSLAERCLMFNLNITQIQCYVLMKMILKSLLNHRKKTNLSSFMCKTVLLHCIENTEQSIWVKNNLLSCLTYCLLELNSCIQNESCPHFIIAENNLMAGQFSAEMKLDLSRKIKNIIEGDGRDLFRIKIDNIGHRLQVKLTGLLQSPLNLDYPLQLHEGIAGMLYSNMAIHTNISLHLLRLMHFFRGKCLKQTIKILINYNAKGDMLQQVSCSLLLSFLCSTLGSVMASCSIGQHNVLSPEALNWLSAGLNSDVSTGRLKLASVLYCIGDIERAEIILRQTEMLYNSRVIAHICRCWESPHTHRPPADFYRVSNNRSVLCLKNTTSFCVVFQYNEINCVPLEMQYEMMRSGQVNEHEIFKYIDILMNTAVVDSLPYLYFLQYKTYNQLRRYENKQRALNNLIRSVTTRANFGHRETALNLLGQCMELENKPKKALQCYMLSLQVRARPNAATFHICKLIAKYPNGM